MTHHPPTTPPSGTPARELLAAIGEALRLPPPATHADEIIYLRLRSERARVALVEINSVLRRSADTDRYTMLASAHAIRAAIATLPVPACEYSRTRS